MRQSYSESSQMDRVESDGSSRVSWIESSRVTDLYACIGTVWWPVLLLVSYVDQMMFIFLWHSMFYHNVSINLREIIRECREMPFRFIVLCLKPPNLKVKMTTTSELEVYMADCILYKWRYPFTESSMIIPPGKTGIVLFFLLILMRTPVFLGIVISNSRLNVLPDGLNLNHEFDFDFDCERPSRIDKWIDLLLVSPSVGSR
jgi:hypothetical protein